MTEQPVPRRRRRYGFIALLAGLAIAAAAFGAANAGTGPFGHHGFGHHGHHRGDAAITPEHAAEMAEHVAERIADKVDADDAQRAQLTTALVSRSADWVELHAEGRALKAAVKEALVQAPRPDRDALQALRKQGVALADRAAGLALDTLLDVTDVLSDAQLAEVRDRLSWWYR